MPLFQIKHRITGAVLFECEAQSLKLVVETAVKSGANLCGANLYGADLSGAYLGGADLSGADLSGHKVNGDIGLIDAGTPNGWHALGFVDADSGDLRAAVGCRNKTIAEGRAYWGEAHHSPDERCEVLAALDYIEAVARLRGWTGAQAKEVAS